MATDKQKEHLKRARARRLATGRLGGRTTGSKNKETLIREKEYEHLTQRFLGVTDRIADSQISIATGLHFLFKIEKEYVSLGKKGGYYKNKPPKLVTSQFEIQEYLEELAENNGELSDDKSPDATYYFITTKEPNNEALKDIQNRIYGKPKESVEHSGSISLLELAKQRDALTK